jgi:hypothetical protein
MELHYLLFDASEDGGGGCSFDAMACVVPERLRALLLEIEAVLRWAWEGFGPASAEGDAGGWNFDLRAMDENDVPVALRFDAGQARAVMAPGLGPTTVVLTVSGDGAFANAFAGEFIHAD